MPDLVVGRDRAHVKVLLEEFGCTEVVSASAFFDKVRVMPFLFDKKLVCDDNAPIIFAQRYLLEGNRDFPLRHANKFASLYSSCYHGTSSPAEIFANIANEQFHFAPIFLLLNKIDDAMLNASLCSRVSALYQAWNIIKNKRILPPTFFSGQTVVLRYLVDLTLLEIEVIKDLSRLGVRFLVEFPLDFEKRGINAAVEFSAKHFERADDLMNVDLVFHNLSDDGPLFSLVNNLFKPNCATTLRKENASITTFLDTIDESHKIASQIAAILEKNPTESVALAVRSINARAAILKRAVSELGINVKDRKGVSLDNSAAGQLLFTLISAKRFSLKKTDLVALINHPLFSLRLEDALKKMRILKILEMLVIDDRVEVSVDARYFALLSRFKTISHEDALLLLATSETENYLLEINRLLEQIPEQASFKDFLSQFLELSKKAFSDVNDASVTALMSALSTMSASRAYSDADPNLALNDFVALLEIELARVTIPYPDNLEINGVEFLLLPELFGRKFDHVFIADISFGRMPQNSEPDPLLDDAARMTLNTFLKKPLLRVFLDDPFEPMPVPPRQALEPFWFACAVASAKQSIHFSCAERDENGSEIAPSEFFLWLKENVTIEGDNNSEHKDDYAAPSYLRFIQGIYDRNHKMTTKSFVETAQIQRRQAFNDQTAADFAFRFNEEHLLKSFGGCLGKTPHAPLTPTLIEAFSECRFKGFSERILLIEENSTLHDDLDPRVLGQLAHRVLELYFQTSPMRLDEVRLRSVLSSVCNEYLAKHFIANVDVFHCHVAWLHDALVSLAANMHETLGKSLVGSIGQEIGFGLKKSSWPPVRIEVNDNIYLLGGRIDRLDRIEDGFLLIDYKLSSVSSLKAQLSPRNFLLRHFQMPVYLRLVKENVKENIPYLAFSFASIRDGNLVFALSSDDEAFKKIFDDDAHDGLAHSIDRIFAPIVENRVIATTGDHCAHCHLTYFCRKKESATHV